MNSFSTLTREYSSATNNEGSVDGYLDDPNLSVTDMIEKYDVPVINGETIKEKKNLPCTVCGARAFGYNFDQISCESCKAFFRRNALRDMSQLHCRFSGHCNITVETRRHCSYCRIKKCLDVGMRKEWIRTEEEKLMKRLRSEKSRRRNCSQQTPTIPALMQLGHVNDLTIITPIDRTRVNNITNCYNQYTAEPTISTYYSPLKFLTLRLDEFFNRKKTVFVNLISYFKHLPEIQTLSADDQVSLIKRNIRLIVPLNYAILRTYKNSTFGRTHIETTGCGNNINLHIMYRTLSDIFLECAMHDPIITKLFIIVLFFTTDPLTTRSIYDPGEYKQLNNIKQIQLSYIELLWSYMIEKCGEQQAIHLFTKMITKYLCVQITMDGIDSIIQTSNGVENIDVLMQTILQLT